MNIPKNRPKWVPSVHEGHPGIGASSSPSKVLRLANQWHCFQFLGGASVVFFRKKPSVGFQKGVSLNGGTPKWRVKIMEIHY